VRTHLGIVRSGHAERLAKICEISGETTAKYIENLIDAIYLSLRTTRKG
jgi:hypothetical protein